MTDYDESKLAVPLHSGGVSEVVAKASPTAEALIQETVGVFWRERLRRNNPVLGLNPMSDLLQFFAFAHLPVNLQGVSQPFAALAGRIVNFPEEALPETDGLLCFLGSLPENNQRTLAKEKVYTVRSMLDRRVLLPVILQMLLEAKDCAVRAVLYKAPTP